MPKSKDVDADEEGFVAPVAVQYWQLWALYEPVSVTEAFEKGKSSNPSPGVHAFMPSLVHALYLSPPFDPNLNFISSPFFSPRLLALIRLSLALYTFVTLLVVLILDSVQWHIGKSFFSYFTHLSYIGLCAYLFAAGIQTMVYTYCPLKKGTFVLRTWPRILQFLHVWLYTTAVTFPIVVTIVYWAILSGPSTFETKFGSWSNISMHALNTVFALFEIVLTDVPPVPWIYLPLCLVILAGYLGIAYITHDAQGFYPYSFLDPKHHGAGVLAGYIIGIAIGECIVYAIVHVAIRLRRWMVRRYAPLSGNYYTSDDLAGARVEELDEWHEMSKPASFDVVHPLSSS
ncbi:hypothetical protein APHAL10511_002993 [Amanita phalloides]|nr:hypothetical protein APHAL10511_002993 [Amanita phalloides]